MLRFKLLLLVSLLPTLCFAQKVEDEALDLDAMVAELNAKCPIEYEGGWAIYSIVNKEDTSIVELMVPSLLNGFLRVLTEDNDNARRMWLGQMSSMFGGDWTKYKRQVVATGRTLVIAFMLYEDEYAATLTFTPEYLKN